MMRNCTLYCILTIILVCACTDKENINSKLVDAEIYMDNDPEMALELLESINSNDLNTRRSQARYALLYSMALDKNYIDITSDSLINIAVDYYRHHGTDEDKLSSLYYRGRVYQNSGYSDKAMEQFVEAEHHISINVDSKMIARLYKAKMVAYQDVFDFQSAVVQAIHASEYFRNAKDSTRYFNTINDIAILYTQLNDNDSANKYLDILKSNYNRLNFSQKSRYHSIQLNNTIKNCPEKTEEILDEYLSIVTDEEALNWLDIADAYIVLSEYGLALESLQKYIYYGGKKDAAYYWVTATIFEKMQRFDVSLECFKEYLSLSENEDLQIFDSDTKFIEERYNAELKSIKLTFYIIIACLTIFLVVLILIILSQKIRKVKIEKLRDRIKFREERDLIVEEKNKVQQQYTLLQAEKEETESMYNSLKDEMEHLRRISNDKTIDNSILAAVEQRINVLNMFILAELSDSFTKIAHTELRKLMENREDFMESTKQTFMIAHPEFIDFLRNKNLTEWEIGCCCLYCIGFNGNEISEYLNRKAIYNVNSRIRHKLGIPKGKTQIDVFLKQKMHDLDS